MNQILTWHEKTWDDGTIDINVSIDSIQEAMFQRNPEKYGNFLETLEKTRNALYGMYHPIQYFRNLFSQAAEKKTGIPLTITLPEDEIIEIRLELFRCIYYAMRLIDDIVDWDTIPPLESSERVELIESILTWNTESIKNPLYKALSIRIFELSWKLWKEEEIKDALEQITISIKFDLDRSIDQDKVRNKEDLEENFHRMDIVWTIVWTAVIFWIRTDCIVELIEPLWEACRVMYNLRDFWEDIYANLINIPKEELERFGISQEELEQVKRSGKDIDFWELPESIKNWFKSEIEKISNLMDAHDANMKEKNCDFEDNPNILSKKWRNIVLKKMVFPRAYVKEIRKRIPQILEQIW